MHIVANEPSLAFYRLQEHVRKSLPPMVENRVEVIKLHRELQGHCYDVEYAVRYELIQKQCHYIVRQNSVKLNAFFFICFFFYCFFTQCCEVNGRSCTTF